jgi:hypothetical protein
MDWSLLQADANKPFLRDVRGFRSTTFYYVAMVLDPILRFNWIFYSIYTHDLQHSSIVSFLVGFSEVTRRGMWTLLRVENEHCTNVARFKASRDIPLPYELESSSRESLSSQQENTRPDTAETVPESPTLSRRRTHTSGRLEAQEPADGMRQRAQTRTFTSILANAHTQDFEKKRKPGAGDSDNVANLKKDGSFDEDDGGQGGSSDDDEDDDDPADSEDVMDVQGLLRERRQENGGREGR